MENNNVVSDLDNEEIDIEEKAELMRIDNEDKRQDAQRRMAWFALIGMLLYPLAVVASNYLDLTQAGIILGDMAPTYFVSVAAIVAAFYGTEAYTKNKNS